MFTLSITITPLCRPLFKESRARFNRRACSHVILKGLTIDTRIRSRHHAKASKHVVSIITFVYDRVDALKRSIQSIWLMNFKEYEHIIVADAPRRPVFREIETLVNNHDHGRNSVLVLERPSNDWGLTPSVVGLSRASGRYVFFPRTTTVISRRTSTRSYRRSKMTPRSDSRYLVSMMDGECWISPSRRPDPVFIDGAHGYRECRSDLDFRPRMIGLHDIVHSDWHARKCCVSKLWTELQGELYSGK